MKKILVAKGAAKYNVLRRATDEIIQGFINKGYEVTVTDIIEDGQDKFLQELSKDYSFVFSCQGIGFDTEFPEDCPPIKKGTPLIQLIKMPYISWIFDDVLYHMPRLKNVKFPHIHLFTVDEEHIQTIHEMFPKAKNIHCMLHGGFEAEKLVKKKTIDILFSGNLGKEPILEEELPGIMPIEKYLIEEAIIQLRQNRTLSVRQALTLILNQCGEQMTSDLLWELDRVIHYLDMYMQYHDRYEILHTLLKAGLKIHLIGKGSEQLINQYPKQVVFLGNLDIDEVVEKMGEAKIVINPLAIFKQGIHERIPTAMLQKAVCFTPHSIYLEKQMGEHLKYIDMNHLEKMPIDILDVLNHYEKYEMWLEDNYVYAKEEHSWKKRGEQIVEYYEMKQERN